MTAIASSELIGELEAAVRDGSLERRVRMLRRLGDLLVSDVERLTPSQMNLFDDVLAVLIERVEARALAQLSTALADLALAPEQTIRRLACHENPTVASPVLLKSPALSDFDLLELASRRSQPHLLAMSGRRTLNEALTDVILKHAGREATRALARNAGARFSDQGYAALMAAAERDNAVAESLGLRPDLPAGMRRDLVAKAPDTVRARLLKAAPSGLREQIQSAIDAIAADAPAMSEEVDYAEAQARVDALNRVGKLNDSAVNGFAVRRERANVVAALVALSGATVETIRALMEESGSTGLIVACRASRLRWQTTLAIINGRSVPALSRDQIEQGKALFETLYVSAAQYTIRFEPPLNSAASAEAAVEAALPAARVGA